MKRKPKLIVFTNNEGRTINLSDQITLEELVKMGVRLELKPKEEPAPKNKNIYIHKP